jgi:hypothetical protein
MAAATQAIDTPSRAGDILSLALAADTLIYQGTLVAINADGRAVPASDTSGLTVVGRANETVDNTDGAAGALSIPVERGVFKFSNDVDDPVTIAERYEFAYVVDDNTVSEDAHTNGVRAGLVIDVDSDGVWIDTRFNGVPTAIIDNGAITTAKLANAAVTLDKLAAIVAPTRVVKLGGIYETVGGAATEAFTITGVAATDAVLATVTDNSDNTNCYMLAAQPTTNTVTVRFNEDPGEGVKLSIFIFRATS